MHFRWNAAKYEGCITGIKILLNEMNLAVHSNFWKLVSIQR